MKREWEVLAEAYGGMEKLRDELGLAQSKFVRIVEGKEKPELVVLKLTARLAADKKLPSPFDATMSEADLQTLAMIGDNLLRGRRIKERTMEGARQHFAEPDLIRLAESDDTPPNIQMAVAHLLGAYDPDGR